MTSTDALYAALAEAEEREAALRRAIADGRARADAADLATHIVTQLRRQIADLERRPGDGT